MGSNLDLDIFGPRDHGARCKIQGPNNNNNGNNNRSTSYDITNLLERNCLI